MNCNKCIYKRNIPGDRHVACGYEGVNYDLIESMLSPEALMRNLIIKNHLNIKINSYGKMKGWEFIWRSRVFWRRQLCC